MNESNCISGSDLPRLAIYVLLFLFKKRIHLILTPAFGDRSDVKKARTHEECGRGWRGWEAGLSREGR